jgi:cyclic beta-1,2-glucan synthetase
MMKVMVIRRVLPALNLTKLNTSTPIRTLIAIPTLLISEKQLEGVLQCVVQNYVAAREKNMSMVVLLDYEDAESQAPSQKDLMLIDYCYNQLKYLNEKFALAGKQIFYGAIRERCYSISEDLWIGWERKRGKVAELFNLVLGKSSSLSSVWGELKELVGTQFIITLDDDNYLVPGSAQCLVGTMAHPINKAVLDEEGNVCGGYGVIVPFLEQKTKRQPIRDLNQRDPIFDWFAECGFPGKGIFDVSFCAHRLRDKLPENRVLSHDTMEGIWIRSGVAVNARIAEGYPSSYSRVGDRGHRWVRGDWQNFLFSVANAAQGKNISAYGWLLILRQIRSSVWPIAAFVGLVVAIFFRGNATLLMISTLEIFWIWVKIVQKMIKLLLRLEGRLFSLFASEVRRGILITLNEIGNLPHRALVNCDAILRTLYRVLGKKRLLQWHSASSLDLRLQQTTISDFYLLCAPLLAIVLALFVIKFSSPSVLSLLVLSVWIVIPIGSVYLRK